MPTVAMASASGESRVVTSRAASVATAGPEYAVRGQAELGDDRGAGDDDAPVWFRPGGRPGEGVDPPWRPRAESPSSSWPAWAVPECVVSVAAMRTLNRGAWPTGCRQGSLPAAEAAVEVVLVEVGESMLI